MSAIRWNSSLGNRWLQYANYEEYLYPQLSHRFHSFLKLMTPVSIKTNQYGHNQFATFYSINWNIVEYICTV